MKKQSLTVQILIRLAFLVVPLLIIFLLMEFTYDPHARCDGDEHRHAGSPVGYVILAFAVCIFWTLLNLIEVGLRFYKRDQNAGKFFLIFLLLGAALVIFFMSYIF